MRPIDRLIVVVLLLLSHSLHAQDTLYFDVNYDPVPNLALARFVEVRNCDVPNPEKCVLRVFRADSMRLISVMKYANLYEGILNGRSSYWFPDGHLCYEISYENGLRQGQERCFYKNGQLKRLINWNSDTITGGSFFEEDGSPKKEVFQEDLYTADVYEPPVFPGGDKALSQYLVKMIQYPSNAREKNIQGLVIVSFVVGEKGTLSEIKVEKNVHALLDQEALRIVSKMPVWKPGRIGEIPVRVRLKLPVRFRLE